MNIKLDCVKQLKYAKFKFSNNKYPILFLNFFVAAINKFQRKNSFLLFKLLSRNLKGNNFAEIF